MAKVKKVNTGGNAVPKVKIIEEDPTREEAIKKVLDDNPPAGDGFDDAEYIVDGVKTDPKDIDPEAELEVEVSDEYCLGVLASVMSCCSYHNMQNENIIQMMETQGKQFAEFYKAEASKGLEGKEPHEKMALIAASTSLQTTQFSESFSNLEQLFAEGKTALTKQLMSMAGFTVGDEQ